MDTSGNQLTKLSSQEVEQLLEEERIDDVLLLLEILVVREESTVKPILDCLYDIGSANLINQKFSSPPVNKILKLIAKLSKPAFRIVAWRWFKNNCPQLIAEWLHEQVKFNHEANTLEVVVDSQGFPLEIFQKKKFLMGACQTQMSETLALPPSQSQEVKHLRSQVRLLIGILIAAIAAFGGSLFWISLN